MSKEEKNIVVPRLRFPDFKKTDQWKEQPLDKLGKLINGLTYSPDDIRDNGLLVLRSSNIQNGQIVLDDNVYVRTAVKGANLSQPNDILICVRNGSKALIGKNAIIPAGMPLSTHGAFMTVFRSHIPSFVFQLFQTDAYNRQVAGDLGATINSINGSNFLKYKFLIPSNPIEQQKIADCLSSLDNLIAAESGKLEALKAHKKGLMQQLFPTEGETVPKLRFEDFKDSGEWELAPIGDKVDAISGYPFTSAEISQDVSGVPLMRGINITEGFIRHNVDIDRYFTGNIETFKKFILNTGDLIIGMDGSKVGKNSALVTEFDSGSLLIQRVARLRAQNQGVIKFIFQLINSARFHSYVNRINTSGGIPHISLKQIETFEIPFPPTIEELQKIATCLSSLDEIITTQTEKVEALKQHKKGLMQGLFPKHNDIENG